MPENRSLTVTPLKIIILYVIITAFILISGLKYYFKQQVEIKSEIYQDLSIISELKANQIINWRKERYGDAMVIFSNNFFTENILKQIQKNEDKNDNIKKFFSSYIDFYHYKDIILFDSAYNINLTLFSKNKKLGEITKKYVDSAQIKKSPQFSDIYFCEICNEIHLDIIIPLNSNNVFIGGIILRIDPDEFLYPLIQTWPTNSNSGETILTSMKGDSVYYLNELRHKKGTALNLKFKIDSTNYSLPSVMAAMGKTGMYEGIDYRGIPVLSYIKKIPGSPWFLLAKVDIEEIYAPVREKAIIIGVLTGLILIAVGIGFVWIWSNQKKSLRILSLEDENRRNALIKHFEYIIKNSNDILVLSDENMNIVEANERALKVLGYSKEEMLNLNTSAFRPPGYEKELEYYLSILKKDGEVFFEASIKKKDGSLIPTENSVHLIKIGGKNYYQIILKDITERKKTESELKESEKQYRSLFDNMQGGFAFCKMIFVNDEPKDFIYLKVNTHFEKLTGLKNVEGRLVSDVIPGIRTTDDELFNIFGRVLKTGKAERFEMFVESLKDWYDISVYCQGKEYFVTVFDVVTKRKATEEKLIENELKYRSLFENSILGIYKTTPDGLIEECNPALLNLLGYDSFRELALRNLEKYGYEPGYSREEFKRKIEEKGEVKGLESSWIKKDGTPIFVRESAKAVKDSYGKIVYYEGTVEDITEKKKMELELRKSEFKYRRLHESLTDGFVLVNMNGDIIEYNDSYKDMLGYTDEELIKLTYKDITPPKWHKFESDLVKEQIAKKGYSDIYEKEYIKKTGEVFPVELRTFLLKNENGENEGMWAIIRDITERKNAEKELIYQASRFESVFSNMYSGLLVVSATNKVEYINDNFIKIFDIKENKSELIGLNSDEIVKLILKYYENPKSILEIINTILENNLPSFNNEVLLKNGKTVIVDYIPIEIEGKFYGRIWQHRDISDSKKMETKIRENEEKFRTIFENSLIGKSVTYLDGSLYVNKAFCEMLGYNEEELKNKKFSEITHPDDVKISEQVVKDCIEGKIDSSRFEKRYIHKNGKIIWCDISTILHKDEKGNPLFFITATMDVTGSKNAEQAIRESENKFRTLFESMNEGVALHELIFDKNGIPVDYRIIDVNKAYEVHTGISAKKAVNSVASIFYGTSEPPYFDIYSEVALTGNSISFEVYFPPLKKHFDISVFSPRKNWFATIFSDITERKNSEAELKESERKLRESQDLAHLGYWHWDIKTGSVEWSDEVYRIFRLDKNNFTPHINSILALSPWPDENKRDKELIEKATKSRNPGFYEQKFLRPDNSIGYYSSTFQGNYDKDGELLSIVGTIMDITERKVSELNIKRLNEELEQKVIERTQEIQSKNNELIRMNKLFVGRELRMVELKQKIKELEEKFKS